jgi:hypothetical protein
MRGLFDRLLVHKCRTLGKEDSGPLNNLVDKAINPQKATMAADAKGSLEQQLARLSPQSTGVDGPWVSRWAPRQRAGANRPSVALSPFIPALLSASKPS